MKKNAYGNIEDLVIDVVVVTPKGTLNQRLAAPRVSSGPSLQQLVLGSEGTLGIITQVVLKVKTLPEVCFATLIASMHCQPQHNQILAYSPWHFIASRCRNSSQKGHVDTNPLDLLCRARSMAA